MERWVISRQHSTRRSFVESDHYAAALGGAKFLKNRMDWLDNRLQERDVTDATPIEGRCVALSGASGVGKNTSMHRALVAERLIDFQEPVFTSGATLKISMPATCTRSALAIAVMDKLGYRIRRASMEAEEAWILARLHLAQNNVRILWIDEVDDIVDATNRVEFLKFGNLFRQLMQANGKSPPLCGILSGLPEMEQILDHELMLELKNRTMLIRFDLVAEADASDLVVPVVNDYCSVAGLTPDIVNIEEFSRRLRHTQNGAMGSMIEMIINAILLARRHQNKTLTIGHFAELLRSTKSVRDGDNIFLVSYWREIDPQKGKLRSEIHAQTKPTKKKVSR